MKRLSLVTSSLVIHGGWWSGVTSLTPAINQWRHFPLIRSALQSTYQMRIRGTLLMWHFHVWSFWYLCISLIAAAPTVPFFNTLSSELFSLLISSSFTSQVNNVTFFRVQIITYFVWYKTYLSNSYDRYFVHGHSVTRAINQRSGLFLSVCSTFFRKLKVLKFRCFDKSGVFSVRKLPVSFLVFICDSLHRENHTLTVYASSWGSCDSGGRAVIHRSQSYWFDLQFPFIYML